MIMKANKQIGFIYKNNENIDKILKDGEVVFERGFLREKTSTTLPITFGGVGKDLKDYRVYGNTVQSKLPSEYTQVDYIESSDTQYINTNIVPTNTTKVEIKYQIKIVQNTYVSVFGSRDNNVNFFINNGGGNTITYYWHGTGSAIARIGNFSQTTFNISTMDALNGLVKNYNNETEEELSETVSFTSFPNLPMYIFARNNDGNPTYATLGMKCWYMKIYDNNVLVRDFIPCYRNSDNEVGLYDLVNNVFYTNQGTGVFTYGSVTPTPDVPIEMVSCGDLITDSQDENYGKYKIPINVRSDNLFDKDNVNLLNAYISLGNSKITSSNSDKCLYMPIKNNTTYTISKILSSRFVIGCVDEEPVLNRSVCNPISENQASNTTYTITSGNNSKYLVIFYYTTSDTLIEQQILDSIQIVEGSTVPDKYIPYYNETTNIYLDEPLRKIDKYTDYIDFVNNKIVRKIRKIILDGSENWARSFGNNLFNIQHYLDDAMFIVGYGLSNYYRYNPVQSGIDANTKNGEFALQSSYGGNVMIKNTDYTVINDFKTWLSTHNTEILYPLATPTEESITLPNIPTIDGNNTLNIETEITPSQVYIKYKSNT